MGDEPHEIRSMLTSGDIAPPYTIHTTGGKSYPVTDVTNIWFPTAFPGTIAIAVPRRSIAILRRRRELTASPARSTRPWRRAGSDPRHGVPGVGQRAFDVPGLVVSAMKRPRPTIAENIGYFRLELLDPRYLR